jgi:DNA-binding transcriptional regulator YdaS (Cro superfamily)
MTTPNPIRKAVALAGGPTRLAAELGIRPQTVSMWMARGRVPAGQVIALEHATGGAVTRYELRADIYPRERSQHHGGGFLDAPPHLEF